MANKTIKAKAVVKVLTDFGYWCLAEIRGLKEFPVRGAVVVLDALNSLSA